MNRFIKAACAAAICIAPAAVLAQDDDGGTMGRIYLVHVKDGHGQQFRDGMKEYLKCYGDNDGQVAWTAWTAETGTMGRWAFTSDGRKWADFDAEEPADEACAEVFYQKFLPHLAHTRSEITEYLPDVSYDKEGEINLVEVIDFEVKDSERFMGAIGKVAEAARASEWHDGHYWYSVWAGGREAADMFVVLPEANFAGFGDGDGFWEMVGKHHGEEAMAQINEDFEATVENSWSDIWRRVPELSYSPEDSE